MFAEVKDENLVGGTFLPPPPSPPILNRVKKSLSKNTDRKEKGKKKNNEGICKAFRITHKIIIFQTKGFLGEKKK